MQTEKRERSKIENTPFNGFLPDGEKERHHCDVDGRTGYGISRVSFLEEVWSVVQYY